MRKADVKLGQEYAAGGSSRYDRATLSHVKVVSLDPLTVRFMEPGTGYPFSMIPAGTERGLKNAGQLVMEWTPYAVQRAQQRAEKARREAEAERERDIAEQVVAEAREYGVALHSPGRYGNPTFTLRPSTLAALLAAARRES